MKPTEDRYVRRYVDVEVTFDAAGRMRPRAILWTDGNRYEIDRVTDVRPAHAEKSGGQGDRYRIKVHGHDRELFFEHNPEFGAVSVGRWFLQCKL
ncbi:MAG: hypothetical protein Q4C53_08925 [Clostridia bacterium]|nr:hypothetical protein [Clostridia bacterium]